MSYAVLRDVSPIHREYLRNMGVGASMSISIIVDGRLCGLIACHHDSPRQLPRHLRAVCELFGSIFSLQIEAREKSEQFAARLASRAVLQKLMVNLANVEDYALGLTNNRPIFWTTFTAAICRRMARVWAGSRCASTAR